VPTGYVRRWHVLGRLLATTVLLAGIGALLPAAPAQAGPGVPGGPCVRINRAPWIACPMVPLHYGPPICEYCPIFFDFRAVRVLPPAVDFEVSRLIMEALDAAVIAHRTGDQGLMAIQVVSMARAADLLDGTPLPAGEIGYVSPDGKLIPSSNATLAAAANRVADGVGAFQQAATAGPADAERLRASGLAALADAARLLGGGIPIPS